MSAEAMGSDICATIPACATNKKVISLVNQITNQTMHHVHAQFVMRTVATIT